MKRLSFAAIVLALSVFACEQKQKEDVPAAAAPEPPKPAETLPASAQATPEGALDQVPVAEVFEEQAAREITAENLEGQLDKLEKEIVE
jgi:hypothetical protein